MPPKTLEESSYEDYMHQHVAWCELNPTRVIDEETGRKSYDAATDTAMKDLHRAWCDRAMEQVAQRFEMSPVMHPLR